MDAEHPWPSNVRSLSVGDVLVVRGETDDTPPRAYAIGPIGFAALVPAALIDALAFGIPKR